MYCNRISTTYAEENSFLAPHKDGIFKEKTIRINFIYFVDGIDNDPISSGATGFYKDNEFKEPLFIPKTIKNSCLVYNNSFNTCIMDLISWKNYFRKAIIFLLELLMKFLKDYFSEYKTLNLIKEIHKILALKETIKKVKSKKNFNIWKWWKCCYCNI